MTSTPDPDDDLLAAEYVLGALDLAERSAAEARLRLDAGFAARVTAWENRLSGLNDGYAETPAPNLLPQIEARLFPTAPRRRWFGAWVGGGVLAALALLAFFTLTPPQAILQASLTDAASPLRYQASMTDSTLTLTRTAGADADAAKDYELWIIEPDKAPISLGVLTDSLTIPAPANAHEGYILAITLEPKGGAPEGKPTGPVVAAGPLTKI